MKVTLGGRCRSRPAAETFPYPVFAISRYICLFQSDVVFMDCQAAPDEVFDNVRL